MNHLRKPVPPMKSAATLLNQSPLANHSVSPGPLGTQAAGHYVIQLSLSANAFSPDSVPHLDIFDLYHLYCDIAVKDGHVRHALRLGFFSNELTAQTVARYLECYFDSPFVMRIGAADEARSAKHSFAALQDVGASGKHAVIELTAPRPLPPEIRRLPVRAVPAKHRPVATSLWSRLIAPLSRTSSRSASADTQAA